MIKILDYEKVGADKILYRKAVISDKEKAVAEIISNVKENGDRALYAYTEKFDGVRLTSLRAGAEEIEEGFAKVDPEFIEILKKAKKNIEKFHKNQIRTGFVISEDGIVTGQRVIPLDAAGLYVPGGTAAYPSTVLMDAIPAKLAGVKNLIITTPPGKDGKIKPEILAAAKIAGVDSIFKVGGAQAIAAMAYGTESIPKVDKIAGPGNAYVAEAKKQVYGEVAIDMIAGPSEILIISDGNSDPAVLAADMLSQAEHDRSAAAVLITTSAELAKNTAGEIEKQLSSLPRKDIAQVSIEEQGKIITVKTLSEAAGIANAIAPEHLELCVDDPFELLGLIRHAGSVFLGRNTPEALGDYMAGPNHTLPTSGTARFSSPLSVDDFVKKMQFSYYSADALGKVAGDIAYFARKEGLEAHARSALCRGREEK